MYIGIILCVLAVFSIHQELLKLILDNDTHPEGVPSQNHSRTTLFLLFPYCCLLNSRLCNCFLHSDAFRVVLLS
jgi:hypothetical protein